MMTMKKGTFLLAAALTAVPLSAQDVERVRGSEVAIYNVAGEIEVVAGRGSEVVVRVNRGGDDADRLEIATGTIGGRETLRVIYPSDEVIYPEMGRRSNTTTTVRDDGTFSDGGRGRGEQMRVRGSGRGMEAWADLIIEVPEGQTLSVYLAVGEIRAEGIDGDIEFDTGSGAVVARDMAGELGIDTGSGSVSVDGMQGDLNVDTGSGSISVSEVYADEVDLDTGSGAVTAVDMDARSLVVDTGSGRVELEGLTAQDVIVDTGSGSVEIELLSDVDELNVDTGSGAVTVYAPGDLGGSLDIESGSGGIDVDFEVQVRTVRRDMMRGELGDGRGEIVIDTGSGSIKLLRRSRVVR